MKETTTPTEHDLKGDPIPLAKSTIFMRGKDIVDADQVRPGIRVVAVFAEDARLLPVSRLLPR